MLDFEIYIPEIDYRFPMVPVKGTAEDGYMFGATQKLRVCVNDFSISAFPVTQALWEFVMGNNPSHFNSRTKPVENVSFNDITRVDGFLDRMNLAFGEKYQMEFRLTSETEWEYAARGGIHWKDDFLYSGSNNLDEVGWYDGNSGKYSDPTIIAKLKNHEKGTTTKEVGQKLPNQLGIYDMCGNVWEWCEDYYHPDINRVPVDGSACLMESGDRVLRGGCHHNWSVHCTVSKRYEIFPDAKDECIGFRIAASL